MMVRFFVLFFFATTLFAHGIDYDVLKDGSYGVKAKYSDGKVMNFCLVKIIDPLGKSFQQGRTDRNGSFFFNPDVKGKWVMSVDDEMGHRIQFSINIVKDLKSGVILKAAQSKWRNALMGLSVIFGMFGLVALFTRRRKS